MSDKPKEKRVTTSDPTIIIQQEIDRKTKRRDALETELATLKAQLKTALENKLKGL